MKRRDFLHLCALGGAAVASARALAAPRPGARPAAASDDASVAQLQAAQAAGTLTAVALTRRYLARIEAVDRRGPRLRAVLELNPDALAIAAALDRERKARGPRGPLHG
ncbi:MAG TPA: amidase, partial [Polyangia bacterium]